MSLNFSFPFLWTLQIVGESGLFTPDDIAYVQEAGVKAVSSTDLDGIPSFQGLELFDRD